MRYVHIENSKVIGIYEFSGEVIRSDYIQTEAGELGQLYDEVTGQFANPEPESE